jgi:hypothetical protein
LKKSTRGRSSVLRLSSLFQSRVHAGTLYLYSSKLSTLSTFVKIYLRTLVKNTLNTLNINQLQDLTDEENKNKDYLTIIEQVEKQTRIRTLDDDRQVLPDVLKRAKDVALVDTFDTD